MNGPSGRTWCNPTCRRAATTGDGIADIGSFAYDVAYIKDPTEACETVEVPYYEGWAYGYTGTYGYSCSFYYSGYDPYPVDWDYYYNDWCYASYVPQAGTVPVQVCH